MSYWTKIGIAVFGVCIATMPAQASDPFKYIPSRQVLGDVADTSKGPAVKIYFNHDAFLEEVAARDKTGQVEIHTSWNDYMTVLSGEAKLTVGGTPVGMKETGPANPAATVSPAERRSRCVLAIWLPSRRACRIGCSSHLARISGIWSSRPRSRAEGPTAYSSNVAL